MSESGRAAVRRWARRSTTGRRRSSSSTSCTAAASTASGVTFPGASPWPLIGHGIDFAWSGTSANGDNQDTFVERLCEPDGSHADARRARTTSTRASASPFLERDLDASRRRPPSAGTRPARRRSPTAPLRSVHGPVFAFATVGGKPVALDEGEGRRLPRARRRRSPSCAWPRTSRPAIGRFVHAAFSPFPGTENWFYVDDKRRGFMQSGCYPRHARGRRRRPALQRRRHGDWQGFDPAAYTYEHIAGSRRPQAIDPTEAADHHQLEPARRRRAGARARPSGATAPCTTPSCSSRTCGPDQGGRRQDRPDRPHASGQPRRDDRPPRAAGLPVDAPRDRPRARPRTSPCWSLARRVARSRQPPARRATATTSTTTAPPSRSSTPGGPCSCAPSSSPPSARSSSRRSRTACLGLGEASAGTGGQPRPEGPAHGAGPPRAGALSRTYCGGPEAERGARRAAARSCSAPCARPSRDRDKFGSAEPGRPGAFRHSATTRRLRPERADRARCGGDAAIPLAEPRHVHQVVELSEHR